MNKYTTKSAEDKRQFYARNEIASRYDDQRFGGPSGAWVNAREIDLVLALLPTCRRVLDLGCGTGRLTRVLAERGAVVGLDSSAAMLGEARRDCLTSLVQGDAFALAFGDASFDGVVALRVAFHFAELDSLLAEAARVTTYGGTVILDTYRWSPRAWFALDRTRWGGGVFAHTQSQIERAAARSGLKVAEQQACFLFSPYIYRRLPLAVVHLLGRIESRVPSHVQARVFWRLDRWRP